MKSQSHFVLRTSRNKSKGVIKVFVGISGGVDSSVALALLQRATAQNHKKLFGLPAPKGFKKYDVTGVFIKTWTPDWLPCNWPEERRSAMRVCAYLDVPFVTLDCVEEYKRDVVDYMIHEYAAGRVPNPDVFCNKYVKFGVFLKKALAAGADFVATGHYARKISDFVEEISFSEASDHDGGRLSGRSADRTVYSEKDFLSKKSKIFRLTEAVDKNKDQSYFLYTLDQHQLAHTLFPIGHLEKPQVRKIAKKFGLPTADKKDSQGLCFIGKVDMKDFLTHYIKTKPGNVLDLSGNIIGRHNGALLYTIGERHGFEINKKTPETPRLFVVEKNLEKNTITVASGKEPVVRENTRKIIIKNLHWIVPKVDTLEHLEVNPSKIKCSVRIRYRQTPQTCTISKQKDGWHIIFETPQTGVAVGQSAVLYLDEICLGGGIIEKVCN